MDQTDIGLRYYRNQKLPGVDVTANYDLVGTAGTQRQFELRPGHRRLLDDRASRSATSARRCATCSATSSARGAVQLNVSYPLGRSVAEAAWRRAGCSASSRPPRCSNLETQVIASVRDAGRQVSTSLKRVESTRKARELAEQSLQAEEKRLAVGLSDTFRLLQAQRDLARQRVNELNAIICLQPRAGRFRGSADGAAAVDGPAGPGRRRQSAGPVRPRGAHFFLSIPGEFHLMT